MISLFNRARIGMAMAAARGAAIVMVVLYHTDWLLSDSYKSYRPFVRTFLILKYIAMPTFFLLVGLSIATANRGRDFIPIINKRVINYVYLYLLWVTISILMSSSIIQMNVYTPDSFVHLIKTYLLPANPLWFLYCLIPLIGSLPIFVRLRAGWQAVWVSVLALMSYLPHFDRWEVAMCVHNAVIFYFGFLFRAPIMSLLRHRPVATLCIAAPVYFGLLSAIVIVGGLQLPFMTELLSVFAVMASMAFWTICPIKPLLSVTALIGRAALPIYLLNDLWLHFSLALLQRVDVPVTGQFASYAVPAGISLLAIIGSMTMERILRRVPGLFGVSAPAYFLAAPWTGAILSRLSMISFRLPPLLVAKRRLGPTLVGEPLSVLNDEAV